MRFHLLFSPYYALSMLTFCRAVLNLNKHLAKNIVFLTVHSVLVSVKIITYIICGPL